MGIYPDKTFLEKDTCTHMFSAALFTIAKTWKQPKCPVEYSSAIKKNKIMPFTATWIQLETLILSEVKSEKEKQIPYDITYIWNLRCK